MLMLHWWTSRCVPCSEDYRLEPEMRMNIFQSSLPTHPHKKTNKKLCFSSGSFWRCVSCESDNVGRCSWDGFGGPAHLLWPLGKAMEMMRKRSVSLYVNALGILFLSQNFSSFSKKGGSGFRTSNTQSHIVIQWILCFEFGESMIDFVSSLKRLLRLPGLASCFIASNLQFFIFNFYFGILWDRFLHYPVFWFIEYLLVMAILPFQKRAWDNFPPIWRKLIRHLQMLGLRHGVSSSGLLLP